MLTIHIKVSGREVAKAVAGNVSDLADASDYEVICKELANEELGIEETTQRGQIVHHVRKQTVWALVQKIATLALVEMEKDNLADD